MGKKARRSLNAFHFTKPLFWLLLITFLGGAFRFYNPDWDYQHSFHPDERNILGQTSGIQASAGWRVQFFAYGQLPVYLYRATGELLSTPAFIWNFFHGNEALAQWFYWFLLAGFLAAVFWFFSREEWALYSFAASTFLFACALFFKFFNVFSIWSEQLSDWPLKTVVLVLGLVVSMGSSLWMAEEWEMEWTDIPLFIAAGGFFILGVAPALLSLVLSEGISRVFVVIDFTLLLAGLGLWWAWVSRWGRTVLAFLSLWVALAVLNHAGRQYTGYGDCMIIGRVWAAAFSTATILAIYAFVKSAYQRTGMALLAAACFAFSAVSIEQAHYCITESFITLMFVVVALCSWEIIQNASWKNYLLAGAAFGFAMAAKTSSLYYVFILVTAHLVSLARKSPGDWEKEGKKQRGNRDLYSALAGLLLLVTVAAFGGVGFKFRGVLQDLFYLNPSLGTGIWVVLFAVLAGLGILLALWGSLEFKAVTAQVPQWLKLGSSGALAFLLFCLLSPWSLLDYQGFMNSQNYEWHVVSIADACYVLQFKDTPRYFYHLKNLMSVELWWPLGITAILGMVWVLSRFVLKLVRPVDRGWLLPLPLTRNRGFAFSLPDLLILCWFIPYFGFIGSWNTKFIRYMVPLVPAFCIFGSRFLTDLFQWAKGFAWMRLLKPALCVLVVAPSLFYSMAYMHVYRYLHPWLSSSIWIYKNVPAGSCVLTEEWDDGLPTGVDPRMDHGLDRDHGPGEYRGRSVRPYEMFGHNSDDSDQKKNAYIADLQAGDYLSIASKKLWYTLTASTPEFKPHGYDAYPVTSRYYRCLWSGLLGYKMVAEFHNFPGLFGWEHPDDMAEESFSVYDHPHVFLFKKVENVPAERIFMLLSSDDYVKGITRDMMRTMTPDKVDDFIAQRRKYLEDRGLWKQLEEATPVTTAMTAPPAPNPVLKPAHKPTVSTPNPAKAPVTLTASPRGRKRLAHEPSPTPTVSAWANPDAKVEAPSTIPTPPSAQTLKVLADYAKNPVIENDVTHPSELPEEKAGYLWMAWFKWLLALLLLGWLALPLTLKILSPIPGGAYSLSKVLGFFLFAWLVWFTTCVGLCRFTLGTCWVWFLAFALVSVFLYWRNWDEMKSLFAKWGKAWIRQETAFFVAFGLFTLVKIFIPHIHDPVGEGYNGGGEAGMDFGFLASTVRGESFPPENMWMAGQPISYSPYYGHIMMGILTKFLGLVPAVTYNLALITLFALIFSCAFGLAYALSGRLSSGWIAGFLCAAAGNPAGAWQLIASLPGGWNVFWDRVRNYDYWGPTRVIPNSINEFPYFSVLYGDLHAHTLVMPFAMLLLGVTVSLYLRKPGKALNLTNEWLSLLVMGFLLGGVSYLNTWEVPVWLVLIVMVYLAKAVTRSGEKAALKGFGVLLTVMSVGLALLGLVAFFPQGWDPQVVGGKTPLFIGTFFLIFVATLLLTLISKSTRAFSLSLAHLGLGLLTVFGAMLVLWSPYFLRSFHPQQSEILWVPPHLRSSLHDFLGIFGFFVTVLGLCFVAGLSRDIAKWMVGEKKSKRWNLDLFLDRSLQRLEQFTEPTKILPGMLFLGLVSMALVWGASWMHWALVAGRSFLPVAFALLAGFLLAAALRWGGWLWPSFLGTALVWMGLMLAGAIPVSEIDILSPGLVVLGLFSVLWLTAFFYLGLCLRTRQDGALSVSYLLVALFFFIVSILEIFVMREYLGGDWLRNNTLFKFYIVAWELGSVLAGVFLPRIFEFWAWLPQAVKRYSASSRRVLMALSVLLGFGLLELVFGGFLANLSILPVALINALFVVAMVGWALMEGWVETSFGIGLVAGGGSFLVLLSLLPLVPVPLFQRMADFDTTFLLPLLFSAMIHWVCLAFWEGRKDLGRVLFTWNWRTVFTVFALAVLAYPICATGRKCHWFFNSMRRQWVSNLEPLSLNGLEYMPLVNPYDAAAIRFMNDHIPDQPCLMEFVGEGYNSWGSRFSIFTGIPALMGWDGHVREWETGRAGMDADIGQRFQATETIFRTLDPLEAKKYLDAYGVRLVMVGTVERNGVPGRKGGYPAEGLAKFPGFLSLIYKNPEVEIYYNPPTPNPSKS